ncbi:MAG: hypothetical protein Q7T36_11775 [Fluviicoccus sp.]|uniref:hypothetical protein n=1 Tax=Fluviicoccus sp. TaxID=2003552 RepID=UPI0027259F43|nr:hypothetical protein [Fluviicoccus sp.]MDO8331138.1 hypothetical protein [Fluviicoccus sp.]
MKLAKLLTPALLLLTPLGVRADLTTSPDSYYAREWQSAAASHFPIWQGFDHTWKREILGVPINHRVSLLRSFIESDGYSSIARMGQKTGVDGNFMKPALFYSTIRGSSGISRWTTMAQIKWTDTIDQSANPAAQSRMRVKVDLPPDLSIDPSRTLVVGLQGIDVATKCEPNKQPPGQPCNSDGAWPINFRISIAECDARGFQQNNRGPSCFLNVDYDRAWTPGKGGIELGDSGIGVTKPLNHRLDYDIKVNLAVYSGASWSISATGEQLNTTRRRLYDAIPGQLFPIADVIGDAGKSATVITGLSFKLQNLPKVSNWWDLVVYDTEHVGRYITSLAFHAGNPSGGNQLISRAGIWSPPNVVNSNVDASLTTRVVTFKNALSVTPGVARGSLCINSSPAAPWFSYWKKCYEGGPLGRHQDIDSVSIP